MTDWREQEVHNETRSREINEWIDEANETSAVTRRIRSSASAATAPVPATITLTHVEYEEVRAHATHFAIATDQREPGPGPDGLGTDRLHDRPEAPRHAREARERIRSPEHETEPGQEEERRRRMTSTDVWASGSAAESPRTVVPDDERSNHHAGAAADTHLRPLRPLHHLRPRGFRRRLVRVRRVRAPRLTATRRSSSWCGSCQARLPAYSADRGWSGVPGLLETIARAWNEGDTSTALACFTDDARYTEPPDTQHYEGRQELFEFFGGDDPPPMWMAWHTIVFDRDQQIGRGRIHVHGHEHLSRCRGDPAPRRPDRELARISGSIRPRLGGVHRPQPVLTHPRHDRPGVVGSSERRTLRTRCGPHPSEGRSRSFGDRIRRSRPTAGPSAHSISRASSALDRAHAGP